MSTWSTCNSTQPWDPKLGNADSPHHQFDRGDGTGETCDPMSGPLDQGIKGVQQAKPSTQQG
jgi:hypothetical protein